MSDVNEEARVEQVKDRCSDFLLSQPGVWGVGVERMPDGEFCLAVHVEGSGADFDLPEAIDGVPVLVIPSGPFVAYGSRRR